MQESPRRDQLSGDLHRNEFYSQREPDKDELPLLRSPLSPWAPNNRIGAQKAAFALCLRTEMRTPPSPACQPEPPLASLAFTATTLRHTADTVFPLTPTLAPQPLLALLSPAVTFPVVDSGALLAGLGAEQEPSPLATAAASPTREPRQPQSLSEPLKAGVKGERSDADLLALLAGPRPPLLEEPLSPPDRRQLQLQSLLQPTPLPIEPRGVDSTADDLHLLGRRLKTEGEAILSERRFTAVLSLAHRHLLMPEPPLEGLTCQRHPSTASILHLCPCELEGERIADSMLLSWTLASAEPPLALRACSEKSTALSAWQQPLALYLQQTEPSRASRADAMGHGHLWSRAEPALAPNLPTEGSAPLHAPPPKPSPPLAHVGVAPSSLETFLSLRRPPKGRSITPPASSSSQPLREGLGLGLPRAHGSPEPKRGTSAVPVQPRAPTPGDEAAELEPLEVDLYCATHLFQDELELMALEQHGFRCVPLPVHATVADVVVDEACGVLLLHASALQEQSHVADAIHRLYRQSFAFGRCQVLILTEHRCDPAADILPWSECQQPHRRVRWRCTGMPGGATG